MGMSTLDPTGMARSVPSTRRDAPQSGLRGALALSDLRRHRRREVVELVIERSRRLPEDERALVEAVLAEGRSVAEVARLRGESARATRRRVHRIVARALSPLFAFVSQHLDAWPSRRRRVAEITVIRGLSLRAAAEELGETVWAVRREREKIQDQLEGARSVSGSLRSAG